MPLQLIYVDTSKILKEISEDNEFLCYLRLQGLGPYISTSQIPVIFIGLSFIDFETCQS